MKKSGPWKMIKRFGLFMTLSSRLLCSHECARFTSQGQNGLQRPLRHRAGGEDQTQDKDHLWEPEPRLGWEVLLVSAFHQSDFSLPPLLNSRPRLKTIWRTKLRAVSIHFFFFYREELLATRELLPLVVRWTAAALRTRTFKMHTLLELTFTTASVSAQFKSLDLAPIVHGCFCSSPPPPPSKHCVTLSRWPHFPFFLECHRDQ